ncbi:PF20097 family protein [Gimesia fumaroli]|uniref:DUF6487 domain-containing protein n=1 Tax=Gimesia fumaroli TaxID=2527976 RepID=A0A518I7H2_9PLAN|nr:PF20097 family protein [Gimesia fumaroli]QDV48994.1 hypothetical protein Enr17x_10090 [Gimesia fumaroli]
MSTTPQCADCGKDMEKGFVPDNTFLGTLQTGWHPGDPEAESRTLFGMQLKNRTETIHVDESGTRKIMTYRCPTCGLLRSYAE